MAEFKICSIEGCGKRHSARGLCATHYERLRLGRDMESNHGRKLASVEIVRALLRYTDDCIIWPFSIAPDGHPMYSDGSGKTSLGRMMCEIKHGPPPTPQHHAAHSCGQGHEGCYNWAHLYWATPKENARDTVLHGRSLKGMKNVNAKLSDDDVREIRRLIASGRTLTSIAKQYGMSLTPISSIRLGKTWKHVK